MMLKFESIKKRMIFFYSFYLSVNAIRSITVSHTGSYSLSGKAHPGVCCNIDNGGIWLQSSSLRRLRQGRVKSLNLT